MGTLNDKVVLISGTAGGMGRAAALAFAAEGAKVFGCDVKVEEAEETVRMVTRAGGEMYSIQPLDLSLPEAAARWIDEAVVLFGGIDVLYNNAGSMRAKSPLSEATIEEWELTIRFELTMPFVVTRAAWPHLVARNGGLVINTASVSAHVELYPLHSCAHGAAKAGVIGLTRMLASEGVAHNIRAVSLSPGIVRSPATARFWSGEDLKQTSIGEALTAKIPMGRVGTCEEIAAVAVFLASPAASYINGTDILVDGGLLNVSYRPT